MTSQPDRRASLSLDLDDKWTYMKTHGDARWDTFPGYLDIVVPRVLRLLDERSLRITFFIVGQDAALPRNALVLRSIAAAGHEIGNHSFHHEPWLHLYSEEQIAHEIALAEEHIEGVTGRSVRGFRGPGFSVSPAVARVLASRGYLYDASTLPTFLGPLARLYYLMTATLDPAEKKRRALLFGSWKDGLRPLDLHSWETGQGAITEVPVTTVPFLRTPFHLSYLLWLLSWAEPLARVYLWMALELCNAARIAPSFLLHPLDFLGPDEAPELAFFPAMRLPLERKLRFAAFVLGELTARYRVVTVGEHAAMAELPLSRTAAQTLHQGD
jgi:peptidoglycan/xylan/chitin deacetylase (PgdA/CDA1 family)